MLLHQLELFFFSVGDGIVGCVGRAEAEPIELTRFLGALGVAVRRLLFASHVSRRTREPIIRNANHVTRPDAMFADKPRILLAGLLALLALGTVVHTLVVTVRRRRREFAIVKVLGFERRLRRFCLH
ncbi:MAG: hypothetical protein JWO37_3054 [Acidimicrobiales bacterium]|nr:hypothetical protein [Acidimicrobiales bacterium]